MAPSPAARHADPASTKSGWITTLSGSRGGKGTSVVVGALAAGGAAVTCATAAARPTGASPADLCWRIAFGLAVTALAGRAKPTAWLIAGGLVAAAAGGPVALAAGFGALGLALAAAWTGIRSPAVGAAVGAAVATAALRLAWPGTFGATALVTATVVAVLAASAVGAARRAAAVATGALFVVGGAVVAVPTVAVARDRARLERAVHAAEAGLDAGRTGDTAVAEQNFGEARDLLARSRRDLDRWWVAPARAVPLVAQHLDAVDRLLVTGSDLAAAGVRAARSAAVDDLQPRDGRIDLAALATFDEPLRTLEAALDRGQRRLGRGWSPWLVGALTARVDELRGRVGDAAAEARRGRRAVEVVPRLLGAGGTRRYVLAASTTAELRGAGGVMGNWGILTATDGALALERFGRVNDLLRPAPYEISVDPEYDARYVDRWSLPRNPQNLLASPDLPTDAEAIAQVLAQAGHGRVDGVIVVDPYVLAALLRLTGPVTVAGWDEPLSDANAARLLLHDQYAEGDVQDPARDELLARTTREVFDRLTHGTLPAVSTLAQVLGPVVASGHLQVTSFDPVAQRFLRQTGLVRPLGPAKVDTLQLVTQSSSSTKLDWFLRRSVEYVLRVDPATGRSTGTATVVLRNTAPPGLTSDFYQDTYRHLPMGVSVQMVSLFTGLEVTDVTDDGEVVPLEPATEGGLHIDDHFVTLPPGGSATVVFRVRGELPIQRGAYRLDVRRQPTVAPDDIVVRVNGRTLFDGPQDRDLVLRSRLR